MAGRMESSNLRLVDALESGIKRLGKRNIWDNSGEFSRFIKRSEMSDKNTQNQTK